MCPTAANMALRDAPATRAAEDLRWGSGQAPIDHGVPHDSRERTWRATTTQCHNVAMPGYSGYLPSAKAENVYGHTRAEMGREAIRQQGRRRAMREEKTHELTPPPELPGMVTDGGTMPTVGSLKTEQGVTASRVNIMRNHWVPTIPGYGGYIPAKEAENIVGGGMTSTCLLARRAIAETKPPETTRPSITSKDDVLRSRLVEFHHVANRTQPPSKQERLAKHLWQHCTGQIPGYMGHVPRKFGESIFGATMSTANRMAGKFCVDKIANPDEHFSKICPQFPDKRSIM